MLSPIVESDTTESEIESSSGSDSDTFSNGYTVPMVDSDSDTDDDRVNIQLESLNWQSVAAADGIVNSGITFAPNHPVGRNFVLGKIVNHTSMSCHYWDNRFQMS